MTDAAKDQYGRLSVRDLKTKSANINGQKVDLITNSVIRGRDVVGHIIALAITDEDKLMRKHIRYRPTNWNYKRRTYQDEVNDFDRYYRKYGS